MGYPLNYETASTDIPWVVTAIIQSSNVNYLFFFIIFSTLDFYESSFLSHLSYSNLIISSKDLYSGKAPYNYSRSRRCILNNSKNPSIFNLSHHPFFFNIANTLLRIFLTLDPPPTFDGNDPSYTTIKTVLV